MTTTLTEFFSATNPVRDPLWVDLTDFVKAKAAANPRHLQIELGPSEVGTPCVRQLAYGLMNEPACNPDYDPLPSILGVAGHNWMQEAAEWQNTQLGYKRWLTETRVDVAPGLSGSSDLYDTDSDTVIDHKFLGYTSYDKYVKDIGPTYRGQIHLYGKGFQNAGHPVKRVAVAIFPRSGTLSKMHLHIENYDEDFADQLIKRREGVIEMLDTFDIDEHPERYEWFQKTPSNCIWCSWWSPNPIGPLQCKGNS